MPAESGRRIAIGIGREVTRGTAVAPAFWVKQLDTDIKQRNRKEMNESSLNVLDHYNEAEIMEEFGGGKLGGKVTDRAFPLLLAAAAGQAPVTASNPDASGLVKNHTISQSQANESLTLSLSLKDNQRDERYPMAMLDTLDFEANVGAWATWSANLIAKKPTAAAGNTVAYVAENEFKAKHITVKLAANVAGLAGASAVSLKDIKFTISRKADAYYTLGSNDPNNIFANEVEVKGDFTALFDAITHRDSFLTNAYQAMSITLTNTDATIGTSANPQLVFTFPKVNFTDWGTDNGLSKMVEQTLGFSAFYSLSDGYAWQAIATNLVTAY